jgi:membrane protease YdiL (CAAX protease family)
LKSPWWSFGFPERRIGGGALGTGFAVAVFVSLASTLVFAAVGLLLPAVAGIGLLIQSSTEEFMYRGYLAQFVRRYSSCRRSCTPGSLTARAPCEWRT